MLLEPPKIFGRKLKPFSLGHAYILDVYESAYVGASMESSAKELIFALWVCGHTYSDAMVRLRSGRFKWEMFCYGRRFREKYFNEASVILSDYIDSYTTTPERWKKQNGSGSTLRVPWQMATVWRLCGGRLSPDTVEWAWNLPVCDAMAFCAVAAASEGDKDLISEDEYEAVRMLDNG